MRLLGVGKLVIASIMSLLMEYPSEVSMKPAKWAWGGKISICHSSEKFLSLHSGTDLSDMIHVLLFVLVKDNLIINYLPDALYPIKGFVHSPVVVLTDGRYPVWCSQVFESAKGGVETCQLLAFFVQGALMVAL